jgi:hypothetical protein
VPIALNIVATTESTGLLFHVRYPEQTFADEHPPIPENTSLGGMVRDKKADVSLGSKIGWLNLFLNGEEITAGKVRQVLTEFFDVLDTQGANVRGRLCLRCNARRVERPRFADERLQLLCDACEGEEEDRFRRETQLNIGNIPLLLIPGTIAAIVGAVLWAGIWYSYPIILQKLSWVPLILLGLIYCGTGIVVGKVVSFFITRVRNRGTHFGATLAVLFCGAALLLGEAFFITALCLKFAGFIPRPALIADLWMNVTREFSSLYVFGKVLSAITALFIAFHSARPKRVLR